MERSECDKCNDVGQEDGTQPKKHIPVRLVYFLFINEKDKNFLNIKPTISFYAFLEYILQRSQKKKIVRMKKKERLKELRKQKKEMKRQGATKTNCGSKNILTFCITQNKLTQNQPCKKEVKLNSDFVVFLLREKINY